MARRFDLKALPGFTTIAVVCFVALYLPIIILVVYAFNEGASISNWEGFSLRWFVQAWNNTQVIEASLLSLKIASIAAILATVAATMAALATTRTKPYRGMTLKYAFINQPLMVPEIVTAVALLIFFSRVKSGPAIPVWAISSSPTLRSASPLPTCPSGLGWKAWT